MQQQQDGAIFRTGLAVEDLDAVDHLGSVVRDRNGAGHSLR